MRRIPKDQRTVVVGLGLDVFALARYDAKERRFVLKRGPAIPLRNVLSWEPAAAARLPHEQPADFSWLLTPALWFGKDLATSEARFDLPIFLHVSHALGSRSWEGDLQRWVSEQSDRFDYTLEATRVLQGTQRAAIYQVAIRLVRHPDV